MSRKTTITDRIIVALCSLTAIAGALLALDWVYEVSGQYPRETSTAAAQAALEEPWWPWAVGGTALVLLVLGAVWFIAHIPAGKRGLLPSSQSSTHGSITIDTNSLADELARRVEQEAPINGVSGTATTTGDGYQFDLRGHVNENTDGTAIVRAANHRAEELNSAFGDNRARVRLLVGTGGPRSWFSSNKMPRVR